MEAFDLSELDRASAREIVVRVIQSLKTTTAQRVNLEKEQTLWRHRTELAKDRSDLLAEAQTRLSDVEYRLDSLRAEEHELQTQVSNLKRQLKGLESKPSLSVDADMLLAELELISGHDDLEEKFREHEGDELLEKLKREMEKEP